MIDHTIPELDRKGLRSFGLMSGAIVAILFGLFFPWVLGREWPQWPWFIAAPLCVLALVYPPWLRPIYHVWMRFGMLASRVTTPIILCAVFFLVISPVALLRRMLGQDPMQRDFEPGEKSYRIPTPKKSLEKLERPF